MKFVFIAVAMTFTLHALAEDTHKRRCDGVDCETFKKGYRAFGLKDLKISLADKLAQLRQKHPNLTQAQVTDVILVSASLQIALAFQTPATTDSNAKPAGVDTDTDVAQMVATERAKMIKPNHPTLTDSEIEAIAKVLE